jgi:K319-like protein/Kelch motif protein
MINKILLTLTIAIVAGALYISCRKSTECETCREVNKRPIANAGKDTILVLPLDSVLLNGGSSKDPDGTIQKYLWSRISGPVSFLIADSTSPKTIVKKLTKGVYRFELKITDDEGLSAMDTVMITVDSSTVQHHQPVADAGGDQAITADVNLLFDYGATATLDGTNSLDPDNDISSYHWTMISTTGGVAIANADSVKTSVSFADFGVYIFELEVTDKSALSSRDTMTISINRDTTNGLPTAFAGTDQTIYLPVNNVQLNGSLSSDPDGDLVSYQWTKVSGPSSFNIQTPNAAMTDVTSLVEGVYQFELKVTDLKGAFSTDTVRVTVVACATGRHRINATLTPFATLPEQRLAAVASAANKIVFAGGSSSQEPYGSARVDIYDIITKTWTIAQLSVPRYGITAVVVGNKILFAGGESGELGDALYGFHSEVDIYDAATDSWSVSSMSEPQHSMAAAALGDKVFFAGANTGSSATYTNKVEIYDASANTWSIKTLSEFKEGISVVATDGKVYFAGGHTNNNSFSNRIDIYDDASDTWTTATLSQPRAGWGGISIDNKIFWAGGYGDRGSLCSVEILDKLSQTISLDKLSNAGGVRALSNGNKVAFFGLEKEFEIYDPNADSWSIGVLPDAIYMLFSANNNIYVSGYNKPNEIWKVEF